MTEARVYNAEDFRRLCQLARANGWIVASRCDLDGHMSVDKAGRQLLVLTMMHSDEPTGLAVAFSCDLAPVAFASMSEGRPGPVFSPEGFGHPGVMIEIPLVEWMGAQPALICDGGALGDVVWEFVQRSLTESARGL